MSHVGMKKVRECEFVSVGEYTSIVFSSSEKEKKISPEFPVFTFV
jgi:diphthamide biosynthesis methyltransferase